MESQAEKSSSVLHGGCLAVGWRTGPDTYAESRRGNFFAVLEGVVLLLGSQKSHGLSQDLLFYPTLHPGRGRQTSA